MIILHIEKYAEYCKIDEKIFKKVSFFVSEIGISTLVPDETDIHGAKYTCSTFEIQKLKNTIKNSNFASTTQFECIPLKINIYQVLDTTAFLFTYR